MNNTVIGFIGLGAMGLPMAVNLKGKCGRRVIGYNRSSGAREKFADMGGETTDSVEDIISKCGIIFLCLPTNDAVASIVRQILEISQDGKIIIDVGSTAPDLIRTLYYEAKAKNVSLIDSPVSGGQPKAIDGTLAIMAGGDEDIFFSIKPLLECMGTSVVYMGPSGCGSTAKIANNMIVGGYLVAMSEAFALASKTGLNARNLFDAIHTGFAQSTVLDVKMPKILKRDFEPTARIEIHKKDIDNAMKLAQSLGISLPMTEIVENQMQALKNKGLVCEDQAAMVKYYEELYGVTVQ